MSRIKHRFAAVGMFSTILLSNIMVGLVQSIDWKMPQLASQALPFGLADSIEGLPQFPFALFLGMGIAGVILAVFPLALSRTKILLVGLCVLGAATLLMAFVETPLALICLRLLSGIGWNMHFCAWVSLASLRFPRHYGVVLGTLGFAIAVGGILGNEFALALYDAKGWYARLFFVSTVGIPILLFSFLSILHMFKRTSIAAGDDTFPPLFDDAASSCWSLRPMLLLVATIFLSLGAYAFQGSFGTYLREILSFPISTATSVMSLFVLSSLLSPLGGWLGDRLGFFNVLLMALPLTGVIAGLLYMGWQMPLPILMLLMFLASFALNALLLISIFALILKSIVPEQNMRAIALYSTALSFTAPFAHILFPYLQSRYGWQGAALIQICGCLLLANLLVWFVRQSAASHGIGDVSV
jgi:MFS family permease